MTFSPYISLASKISGKKNEVFGEMSREIICISSLFSVISQSFSGHLMDNISEMQFSYISFDSQILGLLAMTSAVIDGWDNYAGIEMNMDLKSLTIKASRLCSMADEDRVLQTDNIMQERGEENYRLFSLLDDFMSDNLSPFVLRLMESLRRGNGMKGHSCPQMHGVTELLPSIANLIDSSGHVDEIAKETAVLERMMKKNKPAVFPGMTDAERIWLVFEFYTMMCYLLLHFQTMNNLTKTEINPEDAGRQLIHSLQQYAESPEGKEELKRCLEVLRFDNGGKLTKEILTQARIDLRKEVPPALQLCFVQHIYDIDEFGKNLLAVKEKNVDDVRQCLVAVAKWQMLTRELERFVELPEEAEEYEEDKNEFPDNVFYDRLHDKRISIDELRSRIEHMLPLVTKKNQWFCVWAVLKYHNLLCTTNMESFARLMLSPEWFGKRRGVLPFTGDTLREYSGYFTDTTFKVWNEASYKMYCTYHNKRKWAPSLCSRFQRLCEAMNERFIG